ncbi:hypothetical protein HCG46_10315 [Labrenzia sp. PO1]|uniref:hypothetical protein n=2 Tax=Stappiaceae TaxID=2821832 RepID=UPI0012687092|nr:MULTISPECIES: hypothetical protein [unclassified Labrenzia]NKI58652.1 hypothetical protein [Labrenzia sp. PO1]
MIIRQRGSVVMPTTALIMRRFKVDELALRRLCNAHPSFLSLCEDYATACCALERWQNDEAKAADYRSVIEELEREISSFLTGGAPIDGSSSAYSTNGPKRSH